LLYYAIESWYISVTKIKKELIDNNKQIHWVPEHIKEGRFGKWLEGQEIGIFQEIVFGEPQFLFGNVKSVKS
jgi:isoleucyl-tRNA synthetase